MHIEDWKKARILAEVATINPSAIGLVAQLLGVPACPRCDFVMRTDHVCKQTVQVSRKKG